MIRLENVSMTYGDQHTYALNHVSLTIEDGEFVFIVGDSGAGKTTLFKLLIKEMQPTSGEIFVNGKCVTRLKRRRIPMLRRDIGVVFQNFRLLKDRNVYENIAFAQRAISAPAKDINKNVAEVLTLTGISEKYRSFPDQLSGGEQQRVALARALVNKPSILLADEPTGNLDPGNSRAIMEILEEINRRGTTVIVVTHNHEIVRQMHKRVINLKNG
ncbi:MAG: cell division ATP-binding protein FtsE, partial [Lachnospiraceae bacterium]|nr:cell division ATP-binding protein FtsE [Lachnospiraceae bacterium]